MKTEIKDPRLGRISMSKLEQAALCPGSYEIQLDQPDEFSPIAMSGTRMHDAAERDNFDDLPNEEEMELAKRATELRDELIDGFFLTEPMFEEIADDAKKNHQR